MASKTGDEEPAPGGAAAADELLARLAAEQKRADEAWWESLSPAEQCLAELTSDADLAPGVLDPAGPARMPLAAALYWAAFRDRDIRYDTTHVEERLEDAMRQIKRKLADGEVRAYGLHPDSPCLQPISDIYWDTVRLSWASFRNHVRQERGECAVDDGYRDVVLVRADVLSIWPRVGTDETAAMAPRHDDPGVADAALVGSGEPSPAETTNPPFIRTSNRRGRPSEKLNSVLAEMKEDVARGRLSHEQLNMMKERELRDRYKASRTTCKKARDKVFRST